MSEKKKLFSGVQPSGVLTLGNYVGAIRHFVRLQEDYECFFCVVDLHALTVRQNPTELRQRCLSTMAILYACGIDPKENVLFMQSHVPAHAELAWILDCYTYMGELNRMTQFKDKSQRHADNINAGLYTYPALMVADILLYQAAVVPVGEDQRQHLELTRDIVERFNNIYGDVFTMPEPSIPKHGARVMSLQDPSKKMSKSDDNENAYITLIDTPEEITRKIKRAVTDSDGEIRYGEDKPGVSNLLSIYAAMTGETIEQAVAHFDGAGYGKLKSDTADAVIECLAPIQQKYHETIEDKAFCDEIMASGRERASAVAEKTLLKVKRKVGLASWSYQK